MGLSYYTEIATIMAAVDEDVDGHLRVKEVFESFESFKIICNFIISSQKTLKLQESDGLSNKTIDSIVELACGHGLIGILLAYRFPKLKVYLYDLYKRPTFNAFLRAFEKHGFKRQGMEKVLPNIYFFEEDMKNSIDKIPNSIVICVHGCGEVNKDTIEMASDNQAAGWAVMPCCILKDMYLGNECSVLISDDSIRYNMLCGALANKYNAQLISAIDNRITNRPVVIAGGVGIATDILNYNITSDLALALKRKRLPKLILH